MEYSGEFAPLAGRPHVHLLAQTASTNDDLKALAARLPTGAAVIAGQQTAGRGRRGRHFESPADGGVYLSYLLRPTLPRERLLTIPPLAAVAAVRAVRAAAGVACSIKWPNDLVCSGRKVGGILTELLTTPAGDAVIIGVGLNVHPAALSPETAALAGCLDEQAGSTLSRGALALALLTALDELERTDGLAEYRAICLTLGQQVRVVRQDGVQEGTALDVDRDYGLVVRFADGHVETVHAGEVSVRGLYGYL